uniref:Uncharacterized protein n=1 Tax=Insect-associated ssDNA molecule TaxID=2576298 RepID=A0A4D6BMK9_9VIRU|nr:hypothetical protein [Insect-associated ssDNA molecule]
MDGYKDCPKELLTREVALDVKAKEKAKLDFITSLYKQLFREHPSLALFNDVHSDILVIAEMGRQGGKYAFVTINMDESKFDPVKIMAWLNKNAQKPFKYIKQWLAVMEYHTETGHHPHIHMLIEKDDKRPDYMKYNNKSKLINDYYRVFSPYVSDMSKIDVKHPRDHKSKLKYIMGNKSKPEKKLLVMQDINWRNANGIPHLFGNWNQEDLRSGLVANPSPLASQPGPLIQVVAPEKAPVIQASAPAPASPVWFEDKCETCGLPFEDCPCVFEQ